MQKTKIGWTDYTCNPIGPVGGGWGCSKISPGCDNCYAELLNQRYGNKREFRGKWEFELKQTELTAIKKLKGPAHVFIGDMTDIFHDDVPFETLAELFGVMASRPDLTFQVLTKRPGRMAYFAEHVLGGWPENVWAGTSVELSKYLPRLKLLARVPAKVRFLSAEPLLGPLDLSPYLGSLDWVIDGGESGGKRRPADYDWFRSIRDQCQESGVAYFHKQGNDRYSGRDRLLDGRAWEGMPFEMIPAVAYQKNWRVNHG